MARPETEVDLEIGPVRSLLRDQHPDLAELTLVELGSGWDNVMFRLGPDLLVRLPRRAASVGLVHNELRWLPVLGPDLPLPIPVPVRAGEPGRGYPWPWSIVPWIPGRPLHEATGVDPTTVADQLGGFVAALHQPAPDDAPANPYRGTSLAERDLLIAAGLERAADRLAEIAPGIDRSRVEGMWSALRDRTPPSREPPLWLHGDLHPLNILVSGPEISGVIDFGDLCAGDRATDLSVAWLVLPADARDRFRRSAGANRPVDDATWARARAWAIALGVAYLDGDGINAAIGRRALIEALADQPA